MDTHDVEAAVFGPFLFASRCKGLAKHGVFPAFAYGVVQGTFGSARLELAMVPRVFVKVIGCVRIKMHNDWCVIPNVGQTRVKVVGLEPKCLDTASDSGQRHHVICMRHTVDVTHRCSLARHELLPHMLLAVQLGALFDRGRALPHAPTCRACVPTPGFSAAPLVAACPPPPASARQVALTSPLHLTSESSAAAFLL